MRIPAELFSGDSQTWRDDSARDSIGNQLNSADWVLTYDIRGAQILTLTGVSYGAGWETTITAAQSAALAAGDYYWQAYVTKGLDRKTIGSGQIKIRASLSAVTAEGYDGRTQTKKDLDAVTAEISARVSGGATIEYTIGNRSLKKEPMSALITMQSRLKSMVARERQADLIAQGVGNPRAMFVRFG